MRQCTECSLMSSHRWALLILVCDYLENDRAVKDWFGAPKSSQIRILPIYFSINMIHIYNYKWYKYGVDNARHRIDSLEGGTSERPTFAVLQGVPACRRFTKTRHRNTIPQKRHSKAFLVCVKWKRVTNMLWKHRVRKHENTIIEHQLRRLAAS